MLILNKISKTNFLLDVIFLLSIDFISKVSNKLFLYILLNFGDEIASKGDRTIFKTSPLYTQFQLAKK